MKKKLKATENKVKDVVTKDKRKDLAAQLGEAVIRREKLALQLNQESELCNRLATEIERLGNGKDKT
jgi:hypothetical protein